MAAQYQLFMKVKEDGQWHCILDLNRWNSYTLIFKVILVSISVAMGGTGLYCWISKHCIFSQWKDQFKIILLFSEGITAI